MYAKVIGNVGWRIHTDAHESTTISCLFCLFVQTILTVVAAVLTANSLKLPGISHSQCSQTQLL